MKEQKIPDWIRKHEEDSWQSELFISGGAIYTLFQVPAFLENWLPRIIITSEFNTATVILIAGIAIISRLLLFGFIINLLIRAVWVAILAVHQMFPAGPDFKKLNYHSSFEEKFKSSKGQITKIITLENLAGLSFALSVFLALTTVSGFLILYLLFEFVFPLIFPVEWTESTFFVLATLVIYFASVLGLFDFIAFKIGKRLSFIRKLFAPISYFFSYLNTTKLFFWEQYSIFTRYGKMVVSSLFICILVLSIFVSVNELSNYIPAEEIQIKFFDSRKYFQDGAFRTIFEDDYSANKVDFKNHYRASIPTEVVKENYLPVFVAYSYYMDSTFERVMDSLEIENGAQLNRKDAKIAARMMEDVLRVMVDGKVHRNLRWYRTKNLDTGIDGFKAYLRLDGIQTGAHEISFGFLRSDHSNPIQDSDYMMFSNVFFWKE
ncbi:MAG: hypothetical protein ACFB0A_10105 [Croceivirga sp.]